MGPDPGETDVTGNVPYAASIDVGKVRSLPAKGWSVRPNFHLAYRSSNLYWGETRMDVSDYIHYWTRRVSERDLRQIARDEWKRYLEEWEQDGIISPADVGKIQEDMQQTRRPTLNVCPGLSFRFTWDGEEAAAIDDSNESAFPGEVVAKVRDVMSCW